MTDNPNHQPATSGRRGSIPIYREHSLNLLAAEKYVEQQKNNAYGAQ